ncbi:MAG: HisA/HisF family protein [Archaeoglobaceae archaeon]
MKIFFVIDVMKGIAVLGERGEREKYRAVSEKSLVVKTDDPEKIVDFLRPKYLYVADLDRIMGKGSNLNLLLTLSRKVEEMIADCGFRKKEELNQPFKVVVGTETFDLNELDRKCYVSLDFADKFLSVSPSFKNWIEAVEFLNTFELDGVIVLNIRRVGTLKADFGLIEKVTEISENPVLVGGGIGSFEDLEKLKSLGCSGVLIATAFHKKILPAEIIKIGHF